MVGYMVYGMVWHGIVLYSMGWYGMVKGPIQEDLTMSLLTHPLSGLFLTHFEVTITRSIARWSSDFPDFLHQVLVGLTRMPFLAFANGWFVQVWFHCFGNSLLYLLGLLKCFTLFFMSLWFYRGRITPLSLIKAARFPCYSEFFTACTDFVFAYCSSSPAILWWKPFLLFYLLLVLLVLR